MLKKSKVAYQTVGAVIGVVAGGLIMLFGFALGLIPCMFLPGAPLLEFLEGLSPKLVRTMFPSFLSILWINLPFYGVVGLVIAHFAWRAHIRRGEDDLPHCTNCGYCLVGNTSGYCPECGIPL